MAVYLLYRQHGVILFHDFDVRMGQGPQLHKRFEPIRTQDYEGSPIDLGRTRRPFQFVFFGATKCKLCLKAFPALGRFAAQNQSIAETVLLLRGEKETIPPFAPSLGQEVRIIPDRKGAIGRQLRIGTTPFAFLLDSNGVVRAKGAPTQDEEFAWFTDQMVDMLERHAAG
ncbi:MAG: TlpA family protein disulfide reductase [Terriglobia bacterium]